jgi:hypothetical protein
MKRFALAMLALCLFAVAAFAQTNTGTLTGTVSDPSGVIPGATVVVRDNQTAKERTVVASDSGSFSVPQLDPGTYTVTITAAGHKTFTVTEVKIDVGREYSLNATLEAGDVSANVTVVGGADVINATNAELSNTVSPRQVLELPINGRNPLALLNLQAGVNPTSSSINGQRSSSANYTRDGINVQDNYIRTGGFVQDRPTVDDTGEFTVVTQNASADQGGGGSTQVQLFTPRGSNDFHGAAFIYNRNSRFAANPFFSNSTGVFGPNDASVISGLSQAGAQRSPRPFLNRNQYGGKLQGPIWKNKAFFFVAYEKFVLRQQAVITRRVLQNQFRTGNFTYTATCTVATCPAGITPGQQITVNVLSGAGLAAAIPAANGGVIGLDPTIQARFLSLTPTSGNTGVFTNGGLTQDFRFNQRDNDQRNGFTTRGDFDFNDRHSVYFVYKFNNNNDDRQVDTGGFLDAPFATQSGPTKLYLASYRMSVGANFVNEVRGAYASSQPFFFESQIPENFLIGGLPFGLSSPEASFRNQGRNTKQYTLQDNASYSWGNHSLRAGIDYNIQRITAESNFNITPTYTITTTANPNTPGLASALFPGGISATERGRADALRFLLGGIVGGGTVAANFVDKTQGAVLGAPAIQRFEYSTYGVYFADQWRATPKLTLNLGLRWDYFTPLSNPDQVYLEPVLNGVRGIDAIRTTLGRTDVTYNFVGANSGVPGRFFKPDKNNFAPVLSFAYTPTFKNKLLNSIFPGEGRTVIRGGFRMSYVNDEYIRSADNAASGNAGLNLTGNAQQAGSPFLNARFNALPAPVLPPLRPTPITLAQASTDNGFFFPTIFAIDPELQTQRVDEYNFGIQREIGFQSAIEVRYVGTRSNSLVRGLDFNQIDVINNGFAADFIRARENCRLAAGGNINNCTNGNFNPAIPGSQPLPVFSQLPFGAFLNNSVITPQLIAGTPADLALIYIQNGLDVNPANNFAGVRFRTNPLAGVVDVLANSGKFRYNSLQMEIRRRFTQGFSLQANYTFQKILTDVPADQQNRFDPVLDINNIRGDYARADYDRTHTFNFNTIYELPFGNGKRWLNEGGLMNRLVGGWQVTSIINVSSGPPITIKDTRGTLNRAGRSGRQSATSNLSTDAIKDLVGIFNTPCGIFFINPTVIDLNLSTCTGSGTATGLNLNGIGQTPSTGSTFAGSAGQAFFRNAPGQTGNLERAFINGPLYFNWDAGLIKNIQITEKTRLQLRVEAFNVLNNVNFAISSGAGALNTGENSLVFDINSTNFGRITNAFSPRIIQFAGRFEF